MNRKLPYEEAISKKSEEISSPDEDASWQQMQSLLDRKKDRILPFPLWRNYLSGFMLLVFLLVSVLLIHNDREDDGEIKQNLLPGGLENNPGSHLLVNKPDSVKKRPSEFGGSRAPDKPGSTITENTQASKNIKRTSVAESKLGQGARTNHSDLTRHIITNKKSPETGIKKFDNPAVNNTDSTLLVSQNPSTNKKNSDGARPELPVSNPSGQNKTDAASTTNKSERYSATKIDSSAGLTPIPQNAIISDSSGAVVKLKQQDVKTNSRTADIIAKKADYVKLKPATNSNQHPRFSAGLAVYQQISVGGQQDPGFGYNKNSRIADYVPGIWLKFQPRDKWFLQGEFIYTAPQLVRQFAYSKNTSFESGNTTVTTFSLKKTFFSEVPVSFNYYIKPQWSVGAGLTYSWLRGAIAEKETLTKIGQTQSQSVVNQILPINGFTDSFLYRSNSFLMLQTDYQWKALSLGLRYSRDIQPYITYTMPDGKITDQRNWSLELILRLRLWRSSRIR